MDQARALSPTLCPSINPPTSPFLARLSIHQPGNGADLLRDGRTDTYWQSDGNPPHLVNIQFQRKVWGGGGGAGCLWVARAATPSAHPLIPPAR